MLSDLGRKMIIDGKSAFRQGFVRQAKNEQVQPAGIDLTLKEIQQFAGAGEIDFDNRRRKISATKPIPFKQGKIKLKKGAYKIVYREYVEIPMNCVAFGFPRSSLLRCGADVRCAVWDPGYHGRSESLLIVHNPKGIVLHANAKVAQLVFLKLGRKLTEGYKGRYLGENR
ncbi:MAG: deoxyuridine 5'-triphosphate nucleotidohydrolase [Candidatus Micrarchaeota archaeon]|nr:deoxyuridine 5'-triphosphate nucleotidohydrolase [Candidatus Micrarchaeota archaeon]